MISRTEPPLPENAWEMFSWSAGKGRRARGMTRRQNVRPRATSSANGKSTLAAKRRSSESWPSSSATDAKRRAGFWASRGLPMHGKTTLAQRLRERAAERLPTAPRYEKTERGLAPWYEIPQRRYTHILIDMAGEDYQALGDYNQELPELMRRFLWPALQHADGLFLLLALPMVWSGWSDDTGQPRKPPRGRDEGDEGRPRPDVESAYDASQVRNRGQ